MVTVKNSRTNFTVDLEFKIHFATCILNSKSTVKNSRTNFTVDLEFKIQVAKVDYFIIIL